MIVPKLRNLGTNDYDVIIQLWEQAGLHSMRPKGRDSRDAFAAQLAAGQKVIGLEERGRLIGTVVITHDTRKGWINRLAVHPEYRRGGYAAQLLAAAEKELRAMGIRIFAVLIEADNMTSRKFFSREGYKTHDIVYMTKRESADV
jgi:ribosomal protein S18 acetylase RimI-like enzyme